ncbi:unnamed protein product [Didymodactylos carnosus]|uniref:Uncharacterized protein n=1 Tax=Didymodactylos carnosus TaxID=1234261 RepID=A0A816AI26_9BILA|nr:unnamed protein product [Didymodactylos carnosus]CAF1596481.1 unnamed protein product [Didymodactylos carnosus]CAF3805481.1 unnamed protein product [Didymodactylos carnosus]CAF4471464.1 unnamed protein product [Didymodactylos carnosus]
MTVILDRWQLILPLNNERIVMSNIDIKKVVQNYCDSKHGRIYLCYGTYSPKQDVCCGSQLNVPVFGKNATIYSSDGVEQILLLQKTCTLCKPVYYPHYITKQDGVDYIINNGFDDFILIFGVTGYSRESMNTFDCDVLFKHSSFEAFSKAYAYKQVLNNQISRQEFDCRHFEYTWLFYKAAQSMFKRKIQLIQIPLQCDLDLFLLNSMTDELGAFSDRWSKHAASNPCGDDCSKLMVIDGHQNHIAEIYSFGSFIE